MLRSKHRQQHSQWRKLSMRLLCRFVVSAYTFTHPATSHNCEDGPSILCLSETPVTPVYKASLFPVLASVLFADYRLVIGPLSFPKFLVHVR